MAVRKELELWGVGSLSVLAFDLAEYAVCVVLDLESVRECSGGGVDAWSGGAVGGVGVPMSDPGGLFLRPDQKEHLMRHEFSGDPWGPCSSCAHPVYHPIHDTQETAQAVDSKEGVSS